NAPFFLYLCFHEPHEPIASDKKFSELYPSPDDPSRAAHHGNITQMDAAFGRLQLQVAVLDDTPGPVRFHVVGDGRTLLSTPPILAGEPPLRIDVELPQVLLLELVAAGPAARARSGWMACSLPSRGATSGPSARRRPLSIRGTTPSSSSGG
ncbi:MAG: hypothetical protein HC813_03970, partial [Planctomycetes bacterium]|nr:hypothetical protein [Planctomycetota bacterium]